MADFAVFQGAQALLALDFTILAIAHSSGIDECSSGCGFVEIGKCITYI
jgi:hypothetical protein